jgi:hypothetical protein
MAPGGFARDEEPAPWPGIDDAMQEMALSPWPETRGATLAETWPEAPAMHPAEASEFDVWLRSHLRRLYANVLTEPVPYRFLRLLDILPDGPAG